MTRLAVLALFTLAACASPEPYEPPPPSAPVEPPPPQCKVPSDVGNQIPRPDFPSYCEGADVDNQYCAGYTGRCLECRLMRPDVVEWVLTSECYESA